jgi:hypothetical protein
VKRAFLLTAVFLGFGHLGWPLSPTSEVVPQSGVELDVIDYRVTHRGAVSPNVTHAVRWRNSSQSEVVAVRFGFSSFNVFGEHLQTSYWAAIVECPPNQEQSFVFVQTPPGGQGFHSGVVFVDAIRFQTGEVWKAYPSDIASFLTGIDSSVSTDDVLQNRVSSLGQSQLEGVPSLHLQGTHQSTDLERLGWHWVRNDRRIIVMRICVAVVAVLAIVGGAGPSLAISPTAPTGTISQANPTFQWVNDEGYSQFELWVIDGYLNWHIQEVIAAADVGCSAAGQTCSFASPVALWSRNARWYVRGGNGGPWNSWVGPTFFTIDGPDQKHRALCIDSESSRVLVERRPPRPSRRVHRLGTRLYRRLGRSIHLQCRGQQQFVSWWYLHSERQCCPSGWFVVLLCPGR